MEQFRKNWEKNVKKTAKNCDNCRKTFGKHRVQNYMYKIVEKIWKKSVKVVKKVVWKKIGGKFQKKKIVDKIWKKLYTKFVGKDVKKLGEIAEKIEKISG